MKVALLCLTLALVIGTVVCSSWSKKSVNPEVCDEQRLIHKLFSPRNYCRNVRPNIGSGPVIVGHRFEVLRLVDFDFDNPEDSDILCLDVWEDLQWQDERLRWNTPKCDVEDLHLPEEKLWFPDIEVSPSAAPIRDRVNRNRAAIDSTGTVRYTTEKQLKTYCNYGVSAADIPCNSDFNCTISVQSWGYDDSQISLQVSVPGGGMSLDHYTGSSDPQWSVMATSSTVSTTAFACCPGDDYSIIHYTITLRKNCL